MKKILLITSFSFLNSLAMECPQPMETGEETITLVSAQGHEFPVSASAVLRSHTIANMRNRGEFQGEIPGLFSEAEQNQVPLNEISTETLKNLIPLLVKLNRLLQKNEQVNAKNRQVYIPRKYQPFVNEKLKSISPAQTAALYQAADFLDLPFIINAIAAVINDRILQETGAAFAVFDPAEQIAFLHNKGIRVKQEYILKHTMFRIRGIAQEYSIADYITAHGQPKILEKEVNQSVIDLKSNKITSFFGLNMIQAKDEVHILNFQSNCLYDISLDVQPEEKPFVGYSQLKDLDLSNNSLRTLPEDVFAPLAQLKRLSLAYNPLELPSRIFANLDQLENLDLSANGLSILPERIFAPLVLLKLFLLQNNKFNQEEKERIKQTFPNAYVFF